jgi:hypothetical protein
MTDIQPLAQTRKRLVTTDQVRTANQFDDLYDALEDLRLDLADEMRTATAETDRAKALLNCAVEMRACADRLYKARCEYRHALQEFVVNGK